MTEWRCGVKPWPANEYCTSVPFISPTNSICLLEFRFSQLGRTGLDVGGGGDCFFRAVSHQLYGNSNIHFYVRSVGNQSNIRTSYGTAVYIKNDLNCTEIPYRFDNNDIEINPVANFHIVGIYCSKIIRISHLIEALTHLHNSVLMEPTIPTVLLGDFNVNLMQDSTEQKARKAFISSDTQWINQCTTDYRTQTHVDHIYTNVRQLVQSAGTLESYYSDHNPIFMPLTAL